MKVRIYSQWMEDVSIPARVRQMAKAAKLDGKKSFADYAGVESSLHATDRKEMEYEAVTKWLAGREAEKATVEVA